ncbi:MAG: hypothetical protein Q8R20_01410, partial [Nanoarchaeota archaeon]|nr:hypothetical protein [Nanoarchaeota archaeon]
EKSEEARRDLHKTSPEERAGARRKFLGSAKNHPAAHKRWTEEEEDALTREFQEGKGVEEIARIHGRKEGGIMMRLLKLELIEE